jgi:hypothetical protein
LGHAALELGDVPRDDLFVRASELRIALLHHAAGIEDLVRQSAVLDLLHPLAERAAGVG